ncbi:MAG: hypothetical protein LQ348_006861 [Seirophora lacunosa]|nr:MAG: hypothetical protein LQ348_006861 [Seirophora lacunosa]
MHVLDLPLPAFECVVEQMVLNVGLYKAVRLRHVCKAFDAEVRRAIFTCHLLDFEEGSHNRYMSVEYTRLWLMAKIARPSFRTESALSSAVTRVTKVLLTDTPGHDYEERRLAYVENLCDAIAHFFEHNFWLSLRAMTETTDNPTLAMNELLSAAAAVGEVQKVRQMLSDKAVVCDRCTYFGYASSNAARRGDLGMLATIMQSTRSEGKRGYEPLIAACRGGQEAVVEHLLSLPSRISFSDKEYDTLFEAAATHGHTHILRILLPRISTSSAYVLSRSLHQASRLGYTRVVQYLLGLGAEVNSWDHPGSALHMAANSGFSQVVRLLIDHGVEADLPARRNGTPLYFAARNGHTEVVQILLDHGADINAKGNRHTALARAARNGELTMVKYLLDKGVDPMAPYYGDRALDEAAAQGHEEIVRLLIGLGVDVNGSGGHREPPILRAAANGQNHVVKLLLELGAEEQELSET